ncbi:MAG: LysR family transcriptional regulator [Ramlibacter sp.]|nr:LysR family transcriptional regulator [Ramlibacter sp.]
MDSQLLEYFLRVAEKGSINKAAADLNVSQPALSRHIAALEHEMRGKLFTRTREGVVLTDAGCVLADWARPLLRQFAMVKEKLGEVAAGHLAIGVPQAWQHVFTAPFADRLIQAYPKVALRVHDGVSNVLRDYMSAGVLDLCIMPFEPNASGSYTQTLLVREPIVMVGPAAMGLDPRRAVPLTQIENAQWIIPGRSNALRQQVEHALARRNLEFRLAIETDTWGLCLEFVTQGLGVAIAPSSGMQGRPSDPRVSWAPIRGVYVTWALHENASRADSPGVRAGRELVLRTISERVGAEWLGAEIITPPVKPARAARSSS